MTYENYENEAVTGVDVNTDVETTSDAEASVDTSTTEVEAPVKRTRRKKAVEAVETEDSEFEMTDEADVEESEGGDEAPAASGRPQLTEAERQAELRERELARRRNASLDLDGNVTLGSEKFDEDLAEIFRVRNSRTIVNGPITDIKKGRGDGNAWVEVTYRGYRILIDSSEMEIEVPAREGESEENRAYRLYVALSNMLGARIDFIILANFRKDGVLVNTVDEENRIAIGSRRQANNMKRKNILNGVDDEGMYHIYEGRKVQASVLAVHPGFAYLDVYGYRARLRRSDISNEYIDDVGTVLENGQIVDVRITRVARNKKGEVEEMFVTMRNDEIERGTLERIAAGLNEGDVSLGKVMYRTNNSIGVRLTCGLHAFAYTSSGLQGRFIPNVGDDVSLRILKKMTAENGNPVIRGNIIRVISR